MQTFCLEVVNTRRKPIIESVNGSYNHFIINNEVGYVCNSGDYQELANLISNLDIDELSNIGKHAKEFYFKKYCEDRFIKELEACLAA